MNRLGHFKTITKHRHLVFKVARRIGIFWQGLAHDLSKYSHTEFYNGAKYYSGDHSPTRDERIDKGFSEAWLHHKGRNKHHFEYWWDYDIKSKKYVPTKMPLRYVKEMFADRVAACKVYKKEKYTNSSPLEYLIFEKAEEYFHPDTYRLIESWLTMLSEKGEEETFKYLKSIKNDSDY